MSIIGFATGRKTSVQSLLKPSPQGRPAEFIVKDSGELAGVLRSSLPHGRMAALPEHLKRLLAAHGVPFPDGKEAHALQRFAAEIERKSTLGDDAQLANLDLQNALQKQQQVLQMMMNIMKTRHDTAKNIINNISG